MKSALVTFLLIGFSAIAVFGFLAMHSSNGVHDRCLATAAQGNGVCPFGFGSLFDALFHLQVFRSFSTVILIAVAAAFVALVVLLAVIVSKLAAASPPSENNSQTAEILFDRISICREPILNWISIHENSPAYAATGFQLPATG